MDVRDEKTWVVAELTSQGEQVAEEGRLESLMRDHASLEDDHPVFVPCIAYTHNGVRSVLSVMEGYAFLGFPLEPSARDRLLASPYVRGFLSRGQRNRVLDTIPNQNVEDLRRSLNEMVGSEITVDMQVKVIDGTLLGVVGKVIDLDKSTASVLVEMRSIHAIKTFPRFILHPFGGESE